MGVWWSYLLNASILQVTFSCTFSLGMRCCFLVHNPKTLLHSSLLFFPLAPVMLVILCAPLYILSSFLSVSL